MRTRIITAIVALAIFIPILIAGGFWIQTISAILAFIGVSEIFIMKKIVVLNPIAIISMIMGAVLTLPHSIFHNIGIDQNELFSIFVFILLTAIVFWHKTFNIEDVGVIGITTFYIGQGFYFLQEARGKGLAVLFYALLLVWSTDTFAYFIGRKFGKHKLAPVISPNKTWEGSIGGVVCALIVILIYDSFVHLNMPIIYLIIVTICLSIIGQIGDLAESAIKRHFNVKDSGIVLPGHGGILDRFDSLLFVLPCLHFLGVI